MLLKIITRLLIYGKNNQPVFMGREAAELKTRLCSCLPRLLTALASHWNDADFSAICHILVAMLQHGCPFPPCRPVQASGQLHRLLRPAPAGAPAARLHPDPSAAGGSGLLRGQQYRAERQKLLPVCKLVFVCSLLIFWFRFCVEVALSIQKRLEKLEEGLGWWGSFNGGVQWCIESFLWWDVFESTCFSGLGGRSPDYAVIRTANKAVIKACIATEPCKQF